MITRELAGCVITDEENRVLLIHRKTTKLSEWELPGGKVEEGEEKSDAAIREAREELGIKVGNLALLDSTSFTGSDYHIDYSWYSADIVEGEPNICEPEIHDDWGYFDLEEIQDNGIRFSTNVYDLIQAIRIGRVQL